MELSNPGGVTRVVSRALRALGIEVFCKVLSWKEEHTQEAMATLSPCVSERLVNMGSGL